MKVTFDKNVYEFIINPNKLAPINDKLRKCYQNIRAFVEDGIIQPFICETVFTYEALRKTERQSILSNRQPIIVTTTATGIQIGSNPGIYPGNEFDDSLLSRAIELGFKILPNRRFGKLINPNINSSWYYSPDEDYLKTSERIAPINELLDELGVGNIVLYNLLSFKSGGQQNIYDVIAGYKGDIGKFNKALSERCDGDSVVLHIINDMDVFCTNDCGKSAGHSVFKPKVVSVLKEKYNFRKVDPIELEALLQKSSDT